jgi:hypothetical protein
MSLSVILEHPVLQGSLKHQDSMTPVNETLSNIYFKKYTIPYVKYSHDVAVM